MTQLHNESVAAFLEGPVMVEKGSELLARMSHEMRTPLSAILGFAQLLESGSPSPTVSQKKSIDRILQAGWYLERLMNMTRDLALIDSGTLALPLESVPLAAIMLDVEAMIEAQAQLRGVRVIFPVFEAPCFVSADRIRLQEVLGSLLSAAIDYGEADGTVVVNCETHSAEWVRIGIHDGAEGSSVEQTTRSFAVDGTEISLLLAERLVGLMGGIFAAESVGGPRKVFTVDLKRLLVPMAAGRMSTHPAFGETGISNGGRPQTLDASLNAFEA